MADSAAAMTALLEQLSRLLKNLPEHAGGLVSGSSKVTIVSSDQVVVERLPGLTKALKTLRDLDAEEVALLETGKGRVMFLPPGTKLVFPLDLDRVADDVRQLRSADEIVGLLNAESRLTVAKLRELANLLNVDIPSTIRRKPDVQWHLAQVLAGHRSRGQAS